MSADTQKLTAAIGRRLRAIAARFGRPTQPHPERYGLPVGRVETADVVKEHLNKVDVASEHDQATQDFLPIGPSCC
jgi:hypothetical protein